MIWAAFATLAFVFIPSRAGFAQAIDIAPFVTAAGAESLARHRHRKSWRQRHPPRHRRRTGASRAARFRIDDVRVEGVTVYSPASLKPLYADLIGTTAPREKLLAAVEALQTRYRDDGYILTTVHGAAEHRDGRLIFVIRATEGYISAVELDGDIGAAGQLVLAMLKHLTSPRPVQQC